jgi:hypothetical protein
MAFCFLQWLCNFLQWLSDFPQWLSTFREIQENLFIAKNTKDHYLSFVFFTTRSLSFVIPTTIPNSFVKQNLKTNSAAVKWYQESLFPNMKAQVLTKNGAEQQKH